MRVLITGHNGYIGSVMVPLIRSAGHEVVGLDSGFFADCTFGPDNSTPHESIRRDIRDIRVKDLTSFEAVIHLAALSNDPLGNLNPECTFEINHRASVQLATMAQEAGVKRFLYASSCSIYGTSSPDDLLTEEAPFRPVTVYGESKVRVEAEVSALAQEHFSPVFLRNATAYGASPRLRTDLVVNNLVGWAVLTGKIRLQSDGTPWRPLVHVEDIGRAFLCALQAPREAIHNQAINIGKAGENYQIKDIAEIIREELPSSVIEYAEGAGGDPRCYRVDFSKAERLFPDYEPKWTVRKGVRELIGQYEAYGLTMENFNGPRHMRIKKILSLLQSGQLDQNLRWTQRGR